jgi:hypothetical protein
LALTNEANSNGNYLTMTNLAMSGVNPNNDRGFFPSAFCRTNLVSTGNSTYAVQHTQEEIVASNVVGFDVRGYDSTATQLYTPGVDGLYGSLTDVNAPIAQKRAAAGERGYDDLIVGPSDPGYAVMLDSGELIAANSGTFVDLSWGFRVVNQLTNASGSTYGLSPSGSIWGSALSGYEPISGGVVDSMIRSGKYSTTFSVHQPTFDTFSDYYESDGNAQSNGISENGMVPYGGTAVVSTTADHGIDGFDNNSNGVIDEESERDTSPPYRYAIPAIQIKLRVQDATAGTLQELSMVHSLQGN